MTQQTAIKLFDEKKVRIVWDEEQEKYYFAVVDIVQVLTDSADYQTARKYWKVLKGRLIKEGNETVTNCYQLKLPAADGKQRMTDVADLEQILRIIQSIPSKKAEPVKRWLAEVGGRVNVILKAWRKPVRPRKKVAKWHAMHGPTSKAASVAP